MLDVVYVTRD